MVLLRRRDCLPAPCLPRRGDPAHEVFKNMVPAALAMALLQVNTLVDQGFAYYLIEPGANTHVYLAVRLVTLPFALISMALGTVMFPRLIELAGEQMTRFRDATGGALQMNMFMTVPACVGLILVAPDFIELCFASDEFTADDVRWSTLTTRCLAASIPFSGAVVLYTRALYALSDFRTPVRIAYILVPLNLVLNAVFLFVFGLGVAGLTLATSVGMVINAALLRRRFRAKCGHTDSTWAPLGRATIASAAMAAGVLGAQNLFEASTSLETAAFRLALPISAGIAIYFAVQRLTGSTELKRLTARRRK